MAVLPIGKFPSPNPQYPYVGPNYQRLGEQPGHIYDWRIDKYRPSQQLLQSSGLEEAPPKPPSLSDQLLPIAGVLAAKEVGSYLGSDVLPALGDKVGGLLGGGSTAATTTTGAQTAGGAGLLGQSAAPSTATSAVSTTPAATSGGGLLGGFGALPTAAQAGVVGGLALGAKGAYDLVKGKKDNSPLGLASRATIGVATGGLSEVARMTGLLGHKSTGDYQKERIGQLKENSPGSAGYLEQARQVANANDNKWTSGKYAGQKWSFDKALDLAKEDPTHFIGTLGNFEAFGDRWLNTDAETQKRVVSRLVNEGQYVSDKGDILVKDKDRARKILEEEQNPQSKIVPL